MFVQSILKGKVYTGIKANEQRMELIEEEIERGVSELVIKELFKEKDIGEFNFLIEERLFHQRVPFNFVETLYNSIQQGATTMEQLDEEFGYTREFISCLVMLGLM
jgi:hypothetical protein